MSRSQFRSTKRLLTSLFMALLCCSGLSAKGGADVAVTAIQSSQNEGNGPFNISIEFNISLNNAPNNTTVVVDYVTMQGSATQGVDYVGSSGSVTLTDIQTNASVFVMVVSDTLYEPDENFFFSLTAASGGASISVPQALATIVNDDTLMAFCPLTQSQSLDGACEIALADYTSLAGANTDLTLTTTQTPAIGSVQTGPGPLTVTLDVMASDGATASCNFLVALADSTPPTLTLPADVGIECGTDTSPTATGTATATDNCSSTTVTFADVTIAGTCPAEMTIARTWTATDDSGNEATGVQTISVVDSTLPSLSIPGDVSTTCDSDTTPAGTGMATATDNCDPNPGVTFSDLITDTCPTTLHRTWTATDSCGNAVDMVQIITLNDVNPPIITVPADATIQCGDDSSPANTGMATAADSCDPNPSVTFSDAVSGTCPMTITRTWTATDNCSNAVDSVQTITVDDTTPPALSGPADVTISCDDDSSPANTGMATATDSCDANPSVTFSDTETDSCPTIIVRTWTAVDACGNSVDFTQTVTVDDSTPPAISGPADVTLACDDDSSPANTGMATATDTCDPSPVVTFSDATSGTCPTTITRTWTAADSCGNTVDFVQTITVNDMTPPTIAGPADATLACGDDTSPANTGMATATDSCDPSPGVTFSDVTNGTCPITIARTWTATDSCGNAVNFVQTITINDAIPPSITGPADVTITCDDDSSPANTGMATATDTCDPNPNVTFIDVVTGSCPTMISRIWTATDSCGNAADFTQAITVTDTMSPAIVGPADVTISCDDDSSPANTGMATATDSCDPSPVVTFSDATNGTCPMTITRTWTATDSCLNAVDFVQTITVNDMTPPTITGPADATISCDADSSPANTGIATAIDSCDANPAVTFSDAVSGTCPTTITRTWTAADNCGNAVDFVQTITVNDMTPPAIAAPADASLECGDDTSPANTGMATATDSCDTNPSVTFSDTVTDSCPMIIVRTWTATDACGNAADFTQTITVNDTVPPVLTVPPSLTIQCGDDSTPSGTGTATATDLCDANPVVTFNDTVNQASCSALLHIFRTWTATDSCGNDVTGLQEIIVTDTTPPVITAPADVTITCGDDDSPANTGTATAIDACFPSPDHPTPLIITFTDAVNGSCPLTIVRTWTATDACLNEATATQTITVNDTTPPALTVPPTSTIQCGDDSTPSATGMATATDLCDANPVVTFNDVAVPGTCAALSNIERTWTATDSCGNSSMMVQLIVVVDTTQPNLTIPGDVTVDCDDATDPGAVGAATATDSCDPDPEVTFVDQVVAGSCASATTIARMWTATDACGNGVTLTQLITVTDATPPTLTAPADMTIECGDDTSPANTGMATGTDNCGPPTIGFSDAPLPGNCPMLSFVRTWTATDLCGNVVSATQTITVNDTTPPAITVPPSITIQCEDDSTPGATGMATATDLCDANPVVTFDDIVVREECGPLLRVLRTWTAIDSCGNDVTGLQEVLITDTTPPVLTVPADVTITCGDDDSPASTGMATATDVCFPTVVPGVVTITFSDAVTGSCPLTIVRTWTATDPCLNEATATQTITVNDTTPPTIVGPPDITIEKCVDDSSPANTGAATATDGCDPNPAVTFVDQVTGTCPMTTVRTWTATDSCGNSSTVMQIITAADTTFPTLNLPPSVTITCADDDSPANTGVATASDNCPGVSVSHSDNVLVESCSQTTIERAWSATDACGLGITFLQVITVTNLNGPTVTAPPDVTIQCGADQSPASTGTPTVTHDCDPDPDVSFQDTISGTCPAIITRIWTATDSCGRVSTDVQTISVVAATQARVTDCLEVLYNFTEGQGNTVNDVNGVLPPINLTIDQPGNVTWLPGSGLRVDSEATISSLVPATRLVNACTASEEFSIEAWVQPANLTQGGPARIVTLSENGFPVGGNALLGQQGADFRTRARTTATDPFGKPELSSTTVTTSTLQHVVFTRDSSGMETLYVDNVLRSQGAKSGTLAGSWGNYRLALANEPGLTPGGAGRPWLGDLYLVAMYKKALSSSEIAQNFNAGIGLAPTITSHPQDMLVLVGQDASFTVVASGSVPLSYQWEEEAGMFVQGVTSWIPLPGATASKLVVPNVSPFLDERRYRCVVSNVEGSATSDPATLFVELPPPPSFTFDIIPMNQTVEQGDDVTLVYSLFNDGGVPLSNVSFSSNPNCTATFVGGDGSNGTFDPGETWTYTCSFFDVQQSFCVDVGVSGVYGINPFVNGSSVFRQATACVDVTITPPTTPRVTDCQLVLYRFLEGAGNTVFDLSNESPAIDLTISDVNSVTWLSEGGLAVDSPTVISSVLPAQRIVDACTTSNALTIEAWIRPLNLAQTGPGRIVALSENGFPIGGNAMLGQQSGDFRTRARTTNTDQFGKPELSSTTVDPGALQHVVFTRDNAGVETLYVDNALVQQSATKTGTLLGSWDNYRLALANTPGLTPGGQGRPWLGDLHLVAMYKKALSNTEVNQNYLAGLSLTPPDPVGPTILAGPDDTTVTEGATAIFTVVATGVGTLTYQWEELNGSVMELSGETDASLVLNNVTLADNGRVFRCVVTDMDGSTTSANALLAVSPAPVASLEITLDPEQAFVPFGGAPNILGLITNTGDLPLEVITASVPQLPTVASYCGVVFSLSGTISLAVGETVPVEVCFFNVLESFSYTVEVDATAGPGQPLVATATGTVTVQQPGRVTDGQIALYEFLEPSGTTVLDTSAVSPALDLEIESLAAVTRLGGGGLAIQQPTRIVSPGSANKITTRCQATNEITIEVWLQPLDGLQSGPGRIVSLSGNGFPVGGNFMLGQQGEEFRSRLRSTSTSAFGKPELLTPDTAFSTASLHHLVFTRDAVGNQTLYLDGNPVDSQAIGGTFANWGAYRLCLGNEAEPTPSGAFRPWMGDLHLVAIFERALTPQEVQQNHDFGLDLAE